MSTTLLSPAYLRPLLSLVQVAQQRGLPLPPLPPALAQEVQAILYPDPAEWSRTEIGFAPDDWQAKLLRSAHRRIALCCSRQSGKSDSTALKALYQATRTPNFLTIVLSPSLRQSSEWFKKFTAHRAMLSPQPTLRIDNALSCEFANGARVVSLPSKEGTIRGFSKVGLLIFDEAGWIPDELFRAVRPMLAVSGGQVILLSTPNGRQGFFYQEWTANADLWEQYAVPWQLCPRITPAFIEEERRLFGERHILQEYECQFLETLDAFFPHDLIQRAISSEVQPFFAHDPLAETEQQLAALTQDHIAEQEDEIARILARMMADEGQAQQAA